MRSQWMRLQHLGRLSLQIKYLPFTILVILSLISLVSRMILLLH